MDYNSCNLQIIEEKTDDEIKDGMKKKLKI